MLDALPNASNAVDEKCEVIQNLENLSIQFFKCNVDLSILGSNIKKVSAESSRIDPSTFYNLQDLEELELDECVFENYNFNFPSTLKRLSITNSPTQLQLPSQSFSNLNNLKVLRLKNNFLLRLPKGLLDNNDKLREFDVSQNKIRMIPMEGFFPNSLISLNIASNRIQVISSGHLKMKNLKYLDMSYNAIKVVSTSAFNGLGNLETLNMSHNAIKSIKREHFGYLFHLRNLDISYNPNCIFDNDAMDDFEDLKVLLI